LKDHKKEERHYALPNPISASEYIEIDDSHVSDELNLNDIVTIINPPEENEGQEEIIEELPPVTNKEALSAIKTLEIYIDQQSELNEDDFKLLKSLKRKIKKIDFNSQQQSTLDIAFLILNKYANYK
jgi:hypothetical protein